MTITITRCDGNELGAGEGYLMEWSGDNCDGERVECRAVHATLDDLLQSLLYHFENRYPTNKTERDYYGKVTVERGPV